MGGIALVAVALGLVIAAVFLVLVRPEVIRGAALAVSLLVLTVFGNNSVPRSIWVPAFAFVIAILLIAVARSGGTRVRGNPMFLLLSGWWIFLAIGILLNNSYSTSRMIVYFSTVLAVVFVASRLTRSELRIVLLGLVVIAGIEAVWGAVGLLSDATPLWGYRGDLVRENPLFNNAVARAQGSMGQPIVYGMLMGVATLIVWSNAVIELGRFPRVIALLVTLAGAVLSGTRGVLLALVIGIVVHILVARHLAVWLRNVLLAIALGIIVWILNFGLTRLINDLVTSGSWIHRVGSIASIPSLLARPPIASIWGSGFGSEVSLFDKGYIKTTYGLKVVDDLFVYLLGTTGVVGLVLFMLLCVYAFARATRQGKALIAFCVCMFFSFDVLVWTYSGILLSLCLALPGRKDEAHQLKTDAAEQVNSAEDVVLRQVDVAG
jgi:hypothetical protein